jgi:hypothetical protein
MNKECRMSKESGLTNFIILHSLFLVQASHIQKIIFCQKMAKLYKKVTVVLNEKTQSPSWKNAIFIIIFLTSIPGPFNSLNNYFKFQTGNNQSCNWRKSIFLMKISISLSMLFTFLLGLSGGCPVPDGLFSLS